MAVTPMPLELIPTGATDDEIRDANFLSASGELMLFITVDKKTGERTPLILAPNSAGSMVPMAILITGDAERFDRWYGPAELEAAFEEKERIESQDPMLS